MNFLYVFLGGGLGAVSRYSLSRFINHSPSGFPWPTFLANFISCIILGILLGLLAQKDLNLKAQLLLITGFCGGFSTFSTFSAETLTLIEEGQLSLAFIYITASILVCLVSIFLGVKLVSLS